MIQIVYFDYDNEQCHPDVLNNIDKCNNMNFFVVFVKMSILRVYHRCHKIRTIFYKNDNKKINIIKKHRKKFNLNYDVTYL